MKRGIKSEFFNAHKVGKCPLILQTHLNKDIINWLSLKSEFTQLRSVRIFWLLRWTNKTKRMFRKFWVAYSGSHSLLFFSKDSLLTNNQAQSDLG